MNDNSGKKQEKKKKKPLLNIRELTIDDLAPVFHLGEKLFTAELAPNLYRTWDEYEVIAAFQDDPELCLVAEYRKKIVGFILGTTIDKKRSSWKYGYLVWLGVDPNNQAQGIASKLFNQFQDLMIENGVRILLVDTQADNTPAIKFFEKKGFEKPQKHVYLSLNLDSQRYLYKDKNEDD